MGPQIANFTDNQKSYVIDRHPFANGMSLAFENLNMQRLSTSLKTDPNLAQILCGLVVRPFEPSFLTENLEGLKVVPRVARPGNANGRCA